MDLRGEARELSAARGQGVKPGGEEEQRPGSPPASDRGPTMEQLWGLGPGTQPCSGPASKWSVRGHDYCHPCDPSRVKLSRLLCLICIRTRIYLCPGCFGLGASSFARISGPSLDLLHVAQRYQPSRRAENPQGPLALVAQS